jgi:hypothetical protein
VAAVAAVEPFLDLALVYWTTLASVVAAVDFLFLALVDWATAVAIEAGVECHFQSTSFQVVLFFGKHGILTPWCLHISIASLGF